MSPEVGAFRAMCSVHGDLIRSDVREVLTDIGLVYQCNHYFEDWSWCGEVVVPIVEEEDE